MNDTLPKQKQGKDFYEYFDEHPVVCILTGGTVFALTVIGIALMALRG